MFVDFTSVRRLCDLPSVWRQIEGAGRLRGTADACPEKKRVSKMLQSPSFLPFRLVQLPSFVFRIPSRDGLYRIDVSFPQRLFRCPGR